MLPSSGQTVTATATATTTTTATEPSLKLEETHDYARPHPLYALRLPYDIWSYILPHCTRRDLSTLSTTCKAAHALAIPHLLHTVVIRRVVALQSFYTFIQTDVSLRGSMIRSLTLHRRALLFGDGMLTDVLAHARLLEEVTLHECEHITRRYFAIARALPRCPRLSRLTLSVGGWSELQRESAASADSTLGLLKALRPRLRSLNLQYTLTEWDWPPELVWPHVSDLTLIRSVIPASSISSAFSNVETLRCLQTHLNTPELARPTLTLPALHTLTVDEPSLRTFTLAHPVHTLAIVPIAGLTILPERYDLLRRCEPLDLLAFLRGARPTAASLGDTPLGIGLDWPTFASVCTSVHALQLDFRPSSSDAFSSFLTHFPAQVPLRYFHARLPHGASYDEDEEGATDDDRAYALFTVFPDLEFVRICRGVDAQSDFAQSFTCVREPGNALVVEPVSDDMGLAVQREWFGSVT
jgi:hypothetical protein